VPWTHSATLEADEQSSCDSLQRCPYQLAVHRHLLNTRPPTQRHITALDLHPSTRELSFEHDVDKLAKSLMPTFSAYLHIRTLWRYV